LSSGQTIPNPFLVASLVAVTRSQLTLDRFRYHVSPLEEVM
jgi:hypothetical protein